MENETKAIAKMNGWSSCLRLLKFFFVVDYTSPDLWLIQYYQTWADMEEDKHHWKSNYFNSCWRLNKETAEPKPPTNKSELNRKTQPKPRYSVVCAFSSFWFVILNGFKLLKENRKIKECIFTLCNQYYSNVNFSRLQSPFEDWDI